MFQNLKNMTNLKVRHFVIKLVEDFKYLGVNINCKNNINNEIQQIIKTIKRTYITMNKILSSKLWSWITKKDSMFGV